MPYKKNVCTHCRVYYDKMLPECPKCHGELFKQYNVTSSYRSASVGGEISKSDNRGSLENETNHRDGRKSGFGSAEHQSDEGEYENSHRKEKVLRRYSVEGVIHDFQSFDDDQRMGIVRLYDSIRFGTVFCSEGYSFSVSDSNGDDVDVVCYGVISSRSAKIVNGATVRVIGKENGSGILMAKSILVNGRKVKLVPPPPVKGGGMRIGNAIPIVAIIVAVMVLIAAVYFVPAVRNAIGIFLTMMIVVEIAFLSIRSLRSLATKPVAILSVGGILTVLFYNVGGLGDLVGAYINALAPIAIVLFAIIYLVRSIMK